MSAVLPDTKRKTSKTPHAADPPTTGYSSIIHSGKLIPASAAAAYNIYPPYIPTPSDLPPRINPRRPPPPLTQQYISMETAEPHWQNERRTAILKRREWLRHHLPASKVFYGTAEEKEAHR